MTKLEPIYTTLLSGNRYYFRDEEGRSKFETPFSLRNDLAPMLSWNIRYNGGTQSPWSVAAHAVLVARILKALGYNLGIQLRGLHHDDAEIITGDMTTPMKRALEAIQPNAMIGFEEIEICAQTQIEVSLGIFNHIPRDEGARQAVKGADLAAYVAESKMFRHKRTHGDVRGIPDSIQDLALDHLGQIYGQGQSHGSMAAVMFVEMHDQLAWQARASGQVW